MGNRPASHGHVSTCRLLWGSRLVLQDRTGVAYTVVDGYAPARRDHGRVPPDYWFPPKRWRVTSC